MRKNKAVFLDRDGVLNQEMGDYVCRVEDFHVLEYNYAPLKELQDRGYLLIIATNQGGIAKGWYSEDTLAEMHRILKERYAAHGVEFADVYYCNHHPDFTGPCLCRKPGSLMLENGIAKFDLDPAQSYFIGDRDRDMMAAEKAGVNGILIDSDQPISEVIHLIK